MAIEDMVVRGAPAIGCTAAFGLALDITQVDQDSTWRSYKGRFFDCCARLEATRPTAVNLFYAINQIRQAVESISDNELVRDVSEVVERCAQDLFNSDLETCVAIGAQGCKLHSSDKKLRVLTHCNAGALATAGYGTALGVIRALHSAGKLEKVWVDETRPYLQGARLTSYELLQDNIPHTLIVDSAAASLMAQGLIDWVVVGADRIAANGDTANKIGTYSAAINAYYHNIKFFVAAPWSTIDLTISSGADIPIEMRPQSEITEYAGQSIAATEVTALNPSFDVTPSKLISGIITEDSVIQEPFDKSLASARAHNNRL